MLGSPFPFDMKSINPCCFSQLRVDSNVGFEIPSSLQIFVFRCLNELGRPHAFQIFTR